MLYVLNFKKEVLHMAIALYGFSMHQIFKMKQPNIKFIEQKITAQLPYALLVKTYQVHAHFKTCWKYKKNEYHFSYDWYFTKKTIIAKPLDFELTNDEVLAWRKTLLKKVKNNFDDNVNPAKVNVIDPTKGNVTLRLWVFKRFWMSGKYLRMIITKPCSIKRRQFRASFEKPTQFLLC